MSSAGWSSGDIEWDAGAVKVQQPSPGDGEGRQRDQRRRRKQRESGCQVEGCQNPLELKFHRKFHICAVHVRTPTVVINGQPSRFCQKCSHFEPLSNFDDAKRTCRKALDAHNEARRRRKAARLARAQQPAGCGSRASGTGSTSATSAEAGSQGAAAPATSAAAAAGPAASAGPSQQQQQPQQPQQPPPPLPPQHSQQQQQPQQQPLHASVDALLGAVPAPMSICTAGVQVDNGSGVMASGSSGSGPELDTTGLAELIAIRGWPRRPPPTLQPPQLPALQPPVQPPPPLPGQQLPLQPQAMELELEPLPLPLPLSAAAAQLLPAAPSEHLPLLAPPQPGTRERYLSPARLHRVSLKVFGCSPDQLGPDIRQELEQLLHFSPTHVESSIWPGCTHLAVDLYLPAADEAAAAAVPADQLLAALRSPAALGGAADNALLLQWRGQLAASRSRAAGVSGVAAAEPGLLVRPACIAAPADGRRWPLVQVQLLPPAAAPSAGSGGLGAAQLSAANAVICRQAGRLLPVEVWGACEASAHAALAAAAAPAGSSCSEGGEGGGSSSSDSDDEGAQGAAGLALRPAQAGQEAAAAAQQGLWLRPVGLCPGACELAVQLPLSLPGASSQGEGSGVLLSRPAPLLVLRDAAAALEVQAFVDSCRTPGASDLEDLLRDIGIAAAYLEQEAEAAEQAAGSRAGSSLLAPGFAAAAAAAAAAYVECQGGMPATLALLRAAAAAAASRTAAAGGQEASPSKAWSAGKRAGPSKPEVRAKGGEGAVPSSEAGRKAEDLLRQLEREAAQGLARRPAIPRHSMRLQLAIMAACFLALMAARRLIHVLWPGS